MILMNGDREVNLNDYSNQQLQVLIKGLCKKIVELQKEVKLLKLPTVELGNIEQSFMEERINHEYAQEFPEDYYY